MTSKWKAGVRPAMAANLLPTPPEPIRHTEFPSQPWIDLAADLMRPLPSGEYVLVVVDYYSRYFEVDILTSVTSTKVIESLKFLYPWATAVVEN